MLHPKYLSVRKESEGNGEMSGSIEVEFHECTVLDFVYVGCVSSSYKDNMTSCRRGIFYYKYSGYIPGT